MSHQPPLPFETNLEPERFEAPYVVICEGIDDQKFFHHFIEQRKISDIQVLNHAGGKDRFAERLTQLEAGNIEDVKGILLVLDNDSQPKRNFDLVTKQLRQLGLYSVPRRRGTFPRKQGRPALGILTLPGKSKSFGEKRGNIETLLLQLFEQRQEYKQKVAAAKRFVNATVPDWSEGAKAKVKLRCLLATQHKRYPLARVSEMWQNKKGFLPLLKDPTLDDLEDFLKTFTKV